MPYLSATQMMAVLDSLPDPKHIKGNYIKINILENPADMLEIDSRALAPRVRYFEFFKSDDGAEWLLGSMPAF